MPYFTTFKPSRSFVGHYLSPRPMTRPPFLMTALSLRAGQASGTVSSFSEYQKPVDQAIRPSFNIVITRAH